jgi:hypothetical protein
VGLVAAPVYALAEGGVVHGGASPPSVRRTRQRRRRKPRPMHRRLRPRCRRTRPWID